MDRTEEFIHALINDDDETIYDKFYTIHGEFKDNILLKSKEVYENVKDIKVVELKNSYVYYFVSNVVLNYFSDNINYKKYLIFSSEMGNHLAHLVLAKNYRFKNFGEEINEEKAIYHYMKSAEYGNAKAMNALGYMYQHSIFVEQDYEKMYNYFKKSADLGYPVGIENLAYCYKHGIYVDKNIEMAIYYYCYATKIKGEFELHENLRTILNNINNIFVDSYLKTIEERNSLKERVKELEEENNELRYRPNSIGYLEAEQHFESLLSTQ